MYTKLTLLPLLFRYSVAVGAVALAALVTLFLWLWLHSSFFPLFSLAVLISAWVGGLGPGLLSVGLADLVNAYLFLPPFYSLALSADSALKLSVFTVAAVLISVITARHNRLETAERAQREYLQVTLASIGDAVIITDPTGVVTFLNRVAEEITGWTAAEALGKSLAEVFQIVNEATRQPVESPVAKVLSTGTAAGLANHTILLRRDGRECPIDDSAAPIRDAQGRLLGIILVFRDITERRQREATLQDNHALLHAIIEGTSDAVFMKDRQGRYVMINTAGAQWLGKPVAEVLGRTDADLFASDSVPDILAYDRRVLTTGEPQSYEHTGTAGGNTRTYHSVKVPYRDRHGTIAGVIGIARDISDRAQMEEALRLSESRYRTVSDLVSDYAYAVRVEPDGRAELEWVTEAFSRITGFSREELEAREGLAWLIHPEDMPSVQRRMQVLFSGQPGASEHRILTKNGEIRWLRDYSMAEWDARHGRIVRIIGAGQDITAHRHAAEANLRLAAIVESSDDAIISKSLDGVVTSWNAAAERIFGYRAEEMIGQSILRLIPDDRQDEEYSILERLRKGERVDHLETVRRTKDKWLLDVSLTSSPLRNEYGSIIGASKILRDITARKQAEGERAQLVTELQRVNAELQQFAHIVSHDLNEPLRAIVNFITLLTKRYQGQLDAEADEYLAFVVDGAHRMQQMLSALLAYTRVGGQTEAFTAVDCEAVFSRVMEALHLRITECRALITHDPLPTVHGDATRLGQVWQNLLGNALKFCNELPPRIHITVQQEDQHWRFAVRDNGIGIEPRHAERIFQVFQRLHPRSKYPGTGMGLAICKRIIEQHGGRIWVESTSGEGATFFFTLPTARESAFPTACNSTRH